MTADRRVAVRAEFRPQLHRFEQLQAELQETVEQIQKAAPEWEILRETAFAELEAKLESMPVVEQAKDILMAHQHCGPDEAFELLRQASRRANVKRRYCPVSSVADTVTSRGESPLLSDGELVASSWRRARAYECAALAVEEAGKASSLTTLAVMPESMRARAPVGACSSGIN